MIKIVLSDGESLYIEHLVLDYDGTLACDGRLLMGVKGALKRLADKLQIHILASDPCESVQSQIKGIPCQLSVLSQGNYGKAKLDYIKRIGSGSTICIGNGRDDCQMLKEAALGIAVIQKEGAAVETLFSADIASTDILAVLGLLVNPDLLVSRLSA